jgi:hypothetical protein
LNTTRTKLNNNTVLTKLRSQARETDWMPKLNSQTRMPARRMSKLNN